MAGPRAIDAVAGWLGRGAREADDRAGAPGPIPWDPIVLARVRHLHFTARVLADRIVLGEHRSRRTGQAVEFADYREYAPGMDPRGLDWKVLARSDRLVVRRYETETELPVTVVLDLSGDLGTGETGVGGLPSLTGTKAGYAITLAATMLYWFQRHGEPVGLRLIGGEGARWSDLPPRGGRSHLQLLFLALASVKPGGRAELSRTLTEVGARVRRRSLVTVITDGMEEPANWLPALRSFGRRGTDLRFVHLYDRRELTLDLPEARVLYSPEGGDELPIDAPGVRKDFRAVVEHYLGEVRTGVLAAGGQYIAAPTDAPMERVIRNLVQGGTRPVEMP